jgi:NAD(P)-dependent dehydrogenase (short-subunit alcohol dehydrogenase family)
MSSIIIFGASGGIGQSLAGILKNQGFSTIGVSRTAEKLTNLSDKFDHTESCDYSFESVESVMQSSAEKLGQIQGVVNLCGSLLLKPAHLTSFNDFDSVLKANLYTSFAILRAATKILSAKQGGSIVLCSSAAAQIGLANHEAIAAAKGALISLAKSAAATYASKNIRVNCVAPGLTKTPLTERITSSDTAVKASIAMHPMGRLGSPDDIARMIAFLLTPENSWITGQTIGIDGGLGMLKTRSE